MPFSALLAAKEVRSLAMRSALAGLNLPPCGQQRIDLPT
jgi:hypothetical protein